MSIYVVDGQRNMKYTKSIQIRMFHDKPAATQHADTNIKPEHLSHCSVCGLCKASAAVRGASCRGIRSVLQRADQIGWYELQSQSVWFWRQPPWSTEIWSLPIGIWKFSNVSIGKENHSLNRSFCARVWVVEARTLDNICTEHSPLSLG